MTAKGKIVFTLLFLAVIGFGVWKWWDKLVPKHPVMTQSGAGTAAGDSAAPASATSTTASAKEVVETKTETPKLPGGLAYQPKDNTVIVELSEYAGYAGIIAANGGLAPNTNSVFFKKHGFLVHLTMSEEESWPELNAGKMAASATTADVLAIYGKQFQVIVPAQIGFSRGADGVVVRSEIKRINDLKGKILATSQFTEADFFIRYLAQEAGLGINMLPDLKTSPDPEKLNLIYCTDAFAAGDLFLRDVKEGGNLLAGCVTWDPKTTEVADGSGGRAHVLATTKNLLVVADILIVNKGFAQAHPDMVAGLVEGLLEGNRMVNDNPASQYDVIGKAFKWDRQKTQSELAKVHLSNLPENLAFFSGAIDAAGSFGGIYQSAVYAYGSDLIKDPADSDHFADLQFLKAIDQSGEFKGQQITIAPIRSSATAPVETDPLLSKDIHFLFAPNSANLDMNDQDNSKSLEAIKRLLQVSPGSTVLLRGHVDNSMVEEFRKRGGEAFVRQMALKAVDFSKQRANEIKRLLVEKYNADPKRLEAIGRGWEEPVSATDNDQNRRVEAQWFTLE
ncbi:MAG TPA: phosphate ABC transporter substrate-binding/OmpA family protein [Verrucomicrobiae bacterium]|jgi:NitT/TauT family transport system substrate-binding protein|nr:phosphate ABC transporter substrate-binding/OmpA family protein [Verrucomicrobiae bacterium]